MSTVQKSWKDRLPRAGAPGAKIPAQVEGEWKRMSVGGVYRKMVGGVEILSERMPGGGYKFLIPQEPNPHRKWEDVAGAGQEAKDEFNVDTAHFVVYAGNGQEPDDGMVRVGYFKRALNSNGNEMIQGKVFFPGPLAYLNFRKNPDASNPDRVGWITFSSKEPVPQGAANAGAKDGPDPTAGWGKPGESPPDGEHGDIPI